MYTNSHVPGWVSILMTVVFFGGVQLIVLGIMGVYIGKIFISQKKRPDYIIREKSDFLTEKK